MTSYKFTKNGAAFYLKGIAEKAGDPDIRHAAELLERAAHPTVRCPSCKTALDPQREVFDGLGLDCPKCLSKWRIEIRPRGVEKR